MATITCNGCSRPFHRWVHSCHCLRIAYCCLVDNTGLIVLHRIGFIGCCHNEWNDIKKKERINESFERLKTEKWDEEKKREKSRD